MKFRFGLTKFSQMRRADVAKSIERRSELCYVLSELLKEIKCFTEA